MESKKIRITKEFISLGWKILEAKCRYYYYDGQGCLPDADYDQLEHRYRELGVTLGYRLTATNMVGFNRDRWSCRLAEHKVRAELGLKRRKK